MYFISAVIISLLFITSKGSDLEDVEYYDDNYIYDDLPDDYHKHSEDYEDYDPDEDYDEDYDEHYDEYELVQGDAGSVEFLSKESNHLIDRGNTARLHCAVDNLAGRLMSWKRGEGSQYISMGDTVMLQDSRVRVELTPDSSTLTIALLEPRDTGAYVCEVSSDPPIRQEHRVEIRSAASVSILDRPFSGEIIVNQGDTLRLDCQGEGDPEPTIHWTRQNSLLPNGQPRLDSKRLEYAAVTGRHAGIYVCSGNNGFGQPSTEAVHVTVKYGPEVIVNSEYKEDGSLELVCVVKGYPQVTVSWSREDKPLSSRVGIANLNENGRHILRIQDPIKADIGVYKCYAENSIGEDFKTIHIEDSKLMREKIDQAKTDSGPQNKEEEEAFEKKLERGLVGVETFIEDKLISSGSAKLAFSSTLLLTVSSTFLLTLSSSLFTTFVFSATL